MVKVTRPIKQGSYLRHRLFDQLDQMRGSQSIWISAPAGSGKTTLVSSYIESRKLPCLWYQCDKDDSDPATFFYYMGLAAAKAVSGKRKPLPFFTPEYQQGISAFTRNYFRQLYQRMRKPSLVVFDNYQDITDASVFSDILQTALIQLPDNINVIVISRHDPSDSFIRLQANSSIDILHWQDIRLTEEEARSIIHARTKALDSEEDIRNLYQMSDGWVAGLVLMVAALKNQHGKSTFIGKHSYDEIIAYFGQEIFDNLDSKAQDFFLRTAFLPKMTAQMAVEITGELSANDILQTMNKKNYFISRHGHTEPLYEYHPLYRNFLLTQAGKCLSAEQLHDVQNKSALLLEQNGQPEAAITLLLEIHDWQALSNLVLIHAPDMLKQGRHRLLQEWIESLPISVLDVNPWLVYFKGMSILPFAPAQSHLDFEKAFAVFQTSGDDIGAMLAASGIIYAIGYQFDDFKPMDHWYNVLNEIALRIGVFPGGEIEAFVVTSLVMASKFREMTSAGADIWEGRALNIPVTPETINFKAQALLLVFSDKILRRGVHQALPLVDELRRISLLPDAHPMVSLMAHTAEMQYHLGSGLHDELINAAQKGLHISKKTGIHIWDMWFYSHAMGSFIGRMDDKGAQAWLDRILPMAEGWPNWAKAIYHAELTRMAIIRKEYSQALYEGKRSLDFATKVGSPVAIASAQLLLAQLFWITGKRETALEYFEQGRSYAEQKNSNYILSMALMNEAQFAFDEGDDPRGFLLLRKSIALARECGHAFFFVDNPTLTLKMCQKALEAGIEVEHVQEIIRRRGFVPEKPPVHLENWPWPVKVYTMGRFAILINGTPLPPQRKAQQTPLRLLKAVIALGGRDIACDKLVDLLWPDAEGDAAHHTLETTLQRLRKLLGYPEAIVMADSKLTLDNRYCWVDAWAFERVLGQADALKANEFLQKKELIEKAIALYKGEFFAGERQDAWLLSPTEYLKSKYFKSVWWLVNYLEQEGQWENAAEHCEKFLKVDECREDIYRNLMICLNNMGRKSDALLVYQRCRKILSSALGINPSGETQAIYKAILSEKNNTLPHN